MAIIKIKSFQQFIDIINRGLTVVDYSAAWCGPCKRMEPMYEGLSQQYPEIRFLKVDVEEVPDVCGNVETLPTFIFIKDGQQMSSLLVSGAKPDLLKQNVGVLANLSVDAREEDEIVEIAPLPAQRSASTGGLVRKRSVPAVTTNKKFDQ